MAEPQTVDALKKEFEELNEIISGRLYRDDLGTASLRITELPDLLSEVTSKKETALRFAYKVHETIVDQARNAVASIKRQIRVQADKDGAEYIGQTQETLRNVKAYVNEFEKHWPFFVIAAVEASALYDIDRLKGELDSKLSEIQRLGNQIKVDTDDGLSRLTTRLHEVQQEADVIIETANKKAAEIESNARKTARKVSVKAAQDEFSKAQTWLRVKATFWGVISVVLIGTFINLAYNYASSMTPQVDNLAFQPSSTPLPFDWRIIYFAAIRITILTAIGAAATFCLRLFRSHLLMHEMNLHRQRVANSIAAFVESASTPEQQDHILGKLVDAVINFGNPGLVSTDTDTVTVPAISIDAIMKTFKKD